MGWFRIPELAYPKALPMGHIIKTEGPRALSLLPKGLRLWPHPGVIGIYDRKETKTQLSVLKGERRIPPVPFPIHLSGSSFMHTQMHPCTG